MNILIDINHPAHVHVFRNFADIMHAKGHHILFTSMDKEVTIDLLKTLNHNFTILGKNRHGLFNKIIQMVIYDFKLLIIAWKFDTDIFLSHGSIYAAVISFILGKPHLAFEDTEHAKLINTISHIFTECIITPIAYQEPLGNKHIKYQGFLELCYLHPNYFMINSTIRSQLNLLKNDKFVVVRFVSWLASHDMGYTGLTLDQKRMLINVLLKKFTVFISSEADLPNDLKKYHMPLKPNAIHDILAECSLYIGEGATMASECAVLGIPSIYINPLNAGTLKKQREFGLLMNFSSFDELYDFINDEKKFFNFIGSVKNRHKKMLDESIDVTSFMVWFVENYPESFGIMKSNPSYQYRFQ